MTQSSDVPFAPQFIRIPAGHFPLGTSVQQVHLLSQELPAAKVWLEKGFFDREQPAHTVRLEAFEMARHPVTVAEFHRFLSDAAYQRPEFWSRAGWRWLQESGITQPAHWHDSLWTGSPDLPLVGVSWFEAQAYGRWLAARTGRPYRLPSEAEWEGAARGSDSRLYPWGNSFDASLCNCRESGIGHTLPSGSYSKAGDSPFGLWDMVGNVSEWTLSLFRPYPLAPHDGRDDPDAAGERVIRGGSWFSPAIRARASVRGMNDPEFRDHDVGFRLAAAL